MRFRYKITLCISCLLAVFYGIGGTMLISGSFRSALEQEKTNAKQSYQTILNTLQLVNGIDSWNDEKVISDILERLSLQGSASWAALCLKDGTEILYKEGNVLQYLNGDQPEVSADMQSGTAVLSGFQDPSGRHYLRINGVLIVGEQHMTLAAAYDITPIYAGRETQEKVYKRVYLVMQIACLILVWLIAYILTRPLSKLSNATKRLAAGDLSYRANVHTRDEFGILAKNFNHMAEQIETGMKQMQDTMEAKEQFMGGFAHELKTPMTSIIGYADLIRRQTLSPVEEAEAANYIYTEGKRLERLSFKMLDIFSMEKTGIQLVEGNPGQIVEDMVRHIAPVYQKNQIEVSCECQQGSCLLEPDLFRSLLLNLMDNSRKAMPQGGRIQVFLTMLVDGCCLTVSDNGSGVSEEALRHLTEAFYREDKARSRKMGGAGLGLTLCDRIVELHQGELQFQRVEPHGFEVTAYMHGGRKEE